MNCIIQKTVNGKILESRFGIFEFVSKTIGIDYNEKIIGLNKATQKEPFKYYCINLESEDFEKHLLNMMEEENIKSFDIVFSSLVIHHLKNPIKVLKIISKCISNNGAIILRGADDGTKIAYRDDVLVNDIINKTLMVKGISDRLNGRKLFTQLYDSGFKNIKMIYEIFDTVNKSFDEKLELYQISFPYRKDYFKRQLDSEPENEQYQNDYRWICEKIDELEEKFVAPDFYYSETVPVAIGFK